MLCLQKTLWSNQSTIRQFAMCWLCNKANSCGCCQRLRQTPTASKRASNRHLPSSVALTRSGIRSITHQLLCKPTLQSPASSSSFTWTWEAHRRTGHWEMRSPSAPGPLFSFFITWSIVVRTQSRSKMLQNEKTRLRRLAVLSHADQQLPATKHPSKVSPYDRSKWSYNFITPTSSIPRGRGGSFKNRKAIGEIGCCESRMAGRIHWWTEK